MGSALIVVDVLRHLGTNATADQIRAYIESLHGYAGVNGMMDFRDGRQRGVQAYATAIVGWDEAKNGFVPAALEN